MSPNLSSGHFAKNKLIYEQVIYNMLSLVGLATTLSAAEARRYNSLCSSTWSSILLLPPKLFYIFVMVCEFVNFVHLSARLA